jgi:hypothetical protein
MKDGSNASVLTMAEELLVRALAKALVAELRLEIESLDRSTDRDGDLAGEHEHHRGPMGTMDEDTLPRKAAGVKRSFHP